MVYCAMQKIDATSRGAYWSNHRALSTSTHSDTLHNPVPLRQRRHRSTQHMQGTTELAAAAAPRPQDPCQRVQARWSTPNATPHTGAASTRARARRVGRGAWGTCAPGHVRSALGLLDALRGCLNRVTGKPLVHQCLDLLRGGPHGKGHSWVCAGGMHLHAKGASLT